MIKRLDLILDDKGGVGKISDCSLQHLGQPLKTAAGRLMLCKPFLATAVVWLDSAARRCGLRLRFCVRKTCPATGTRQPSLTHRQFSSCDKFHIELEKQVLYNRGVAGDLMRRRAEKIKSHFGEDIRIGGFAGYDLFIRPGFSNTAELVLRARNSYSTRVTDTALSTICSLESMVQGFEERAGRLEADIKDSQKRATELEAKVGALFEKDGRYHHLAARQSEIEEELDLTKNQARSHVDGAAPDESENRSEKQIETKSSKQSRRAAVHV